MYFKVSMNYLKYQIHTSDQYENLNSQLLIETTLFSTFSSIKIHLLFKISWLKGSLDFQAGLTNIINILIQKLQSEDHQTVGVASGILANLTCNNQQNKQDCLKFSGIETLLR